jgi:ATP-dependent Clp protease ATP-binding subunit ClpB
MQLEIEREALKKETDRHSRDRLDALEKELSELKADYEEMSASGRRKSRASTRSAGSRRKSTRSSRHRTAERNYDLGTSSELKYGRLPSSSAVEEAKRREEPAARFCARRSREEEIARS